MGGFKTEKMVTSFVDSEQNSFGERQQKWFPKGLSIPKVFGINQI